MEEPSPGPAVRLAERLLRHRLETGELGVLRRIGVHRRVGCVGEDGTVQSGRSEVQPGTTGARSWKSGVQSEEWGAFREE